MVKTSPYQDGTDYTELGNVGSDAEAARDAAIAAQEAAEEAATNAASSESAAATSASSASTSATNAASSASAASTSETNAASSASAASTSATSASTSATTATTQATNAASSASAASTSATNAASSATAASGSATTASTAATNAGNSATAAAASASAASTSETNAASSATAASGSATTATTQATNASNSATAASGSASTASTAATNASNSASAASTSASNASTSATNAATSETNAAASATTAASLAAKITGTSTTSLSIGTGSKVFTTQSGKDFNVGTFAEVVSDADPATDWMFGQITAYSGTSLTINVVATNGSGTHTDWSIYGRAGPRGAAASGTGDFEGPASSAVGNIVTFADTTGKLGADGGTFVSNVASVTHAATSKSTPVDADELGLIDSAASNVLKRLTWANLKTTLNAIYDWATVVNGATGKTTPVAADSIGIIDSAASNVLKKVTFTNLIAAFKSSAANLWGGSNDTTYLTAKNINDASARVVLTSGTTIATDASLGVNFYVVLAHNATFSAPTNLRDGVTYSWMIKQDGTGSRTGAFNSIFEFPSAPTLSTAAGKYDMVVAEYNSTDTKLIARFSKGST